MFVVLDIASSGHTSRARKWQLVASRNGSCLTMDTFDNCQDAITAAGTLHSLMELAGSDLHLALQTVDVRTPAGGIGFEMLLPGHMSWHVIRLILLFSGQTESFAGFPLNHGLRGLVDLSWEQAETTCVRVRVSFRAGLAEGQIQSIK